jgi:pimeloyl-ACP methyl ester carboxylesterase
MLRTIETSTLSLAYEEHGAEDGRPVLLMHGFPYSPRAYDEVAPALAAQGFRAIVPYLRGYGPTRFLDPKRIRSGEQAALGQDLLDLIAGLKLERPLVVGYDWGGRAACIAAAVAPQIVRGLLTCGAYNMFGPPVTTPGPPAKEHNMWYQYYLHMPRGRYMLNDHRREFCRYLWEQWSPRWKFDDATFDATARYFDNPDFVDVVLHSYRHRFGLVPGDPALADLGRQVEQRPDITVPTILVRGDHGLASSVSERDRARFTGPFLYREAPGAGHSPPQETPAVIVQAILDLDKMSA